MIVSHRHKFIFLHAPRTGGLSVKIALAHYCGPNDIIAPEERFQADVSDNSYNLEPQNHEILSHTNEGGRFAPHTTAVEAKERLDAINPAIWPSYFKFAGVRNPWDFYASHWWAYPPGQAEREHGCFKNFVRWHYSQNGAPNRDFYWIPCSHLLRKRLKTVGKQCGNGAHRFHTVSHRATFALDDFMLCPHLDAEYRRIMPKLGLWPNLPLPRTHGKRRRLHHENDHYSTLYDDELRDEVGELAWKEVRRFGLRFDDHRGKTPLPDTRNGG